MHPKVFHLWMCVLLLAPPACKIIDRGQDGAAPADTAAAQSATESLVLRLESPGVLRPGEQGTVRVSIANRGDSVPRGVQLELIVPGWVEPSPPAPGGREVTVGVTEEEGVRLTYRLDEPPLRPGKTEIVEQGIRVPPTTLATGGGRPWGRVVRARLTGPGGRAMTEVESSLAFDSAAVADSTAIVQDTAAAASAPRDRLGAARLGMPVAELRRAAPGARDTSWTREGTAERGVVVPMGGGGRAVALLSGDSVARIEVRDPAARTREGLGVGSTVGELRSAFGTACADVAEGEVVVWFPGAPGIGFALDVKPPADPRLVRARPDRVPATARVTRWWLRRGADRCPAP
jgi:hypothetical protein